MAERTTRRTTDAMAVAVAIADMCGFDPSMTARERREKMDALVKAIVQATGNPEPE